MKIIKRKSKNTYVNEKKETRHYYNYFIEFDNGKRIMFKPINNDDYRRLDMVAEYERTKVD